MKKILLLLIGGVTISSLLTGCNTSKTTVMGTTTSQPISTPVVTPDPEHTINNESRKAPTSIKITDYKIENPKGDRTADNVADKNGEYFAIGSDIVKCSDYQDIAITADITNNRDELLNLNSMAWSAALSDGYKLKIDYDNKLNSQLQSKSSLSATLHIIKEKSLKGDKIILNYWDINYDDKFKKFMKDAMSGASEEECKENYPEFFDESLKYKFEILLTK